MNADQLEDRLARTAEALPDPAPTTIDQVRARAAARRTHRRAVIVALAIPVVALAGVVIPELLRSSGDVPIISPVDEPNQATVQCDYGAVGASVATVTLRYLGGAEVHAQIADAPQVGGRYYAYCSDGERGRAAISFYDAQGEELHPPR